jgi:heat shock protein HtpX
MIIGTLWSWFGGAATLLSISGARLIQHADDPQLYNVVEDLAIAGGIPTPPVYMIESPALNAFATGRDPQHAAVAITRGLREKLTRDELAGVMAHELSHVRHYDIRLTMLMATMVGMIVLACDVLWQIVRYGGPARRSSDDRDNKGGGPIVLVIIVLAVILALIAPWLARVIQLSVSRQREYLADAGAVELTRYPQGLIDALKKLGADRTPLEAANRATAHLYIVNPILNATDDSDWDSRWSTHPPLTERINRLEALLR